MDSLYFPYVFQSHCHFRSFSRTMENELNYKLIDPSIHQLMVNWNFFVELFSFSHIFLRTAVVSKVRSKKKVLSIFRTAFFMLYNCILKIRTTKKRTAPQKKTIKKALIVYIDPMNNALNLEFIQIHSTIFEKYNID